MLAGLPPQVGLYAALVPPLAYAFLGTSRALAVGPAAVVSLLVAEGLGHADPAAQVGLALTLGLVVGLMQLGMGLSGLGALANFLSQPVLQGFTSAAALIIAGSQLGPLLGLTLPRSEILPLRLWHAWWALPDASLPTLALSAVALASLLGLKRYWPRFPRALAVVVGGAVVVWALGLDERGVAVVGDVPAGLPGPTLPSLDLETLTWLVPAAVTIALIGFVESISVASAIAARTGEELDSDRELVALGAANLLGAFWGGFPVAGSFGRTAVASESGASIGLHGIVSAVAVAVVLLFFTPLFAYLPLAVLAAIIMSAVAGLIELHAVPRLWRISRPDLGLLGLTFGATLLLGVEVGVLAGVAASVGVHLRRVGRPHVAVLGRLPGTTTYRKLELHPEAETFPGVLLVRLDAPLFFANTRFLRQTLHRLEEDHGPLRAVVLDATGIGHVDASAESELQHLEDDYVKRGIALWIAGAHEPVRDLFVRSGLATRLGLRLVLRVDDAVQALTEPLETPPATGV
jgi:SulP family sulfate permease